MKLDAFWWLIIASVLLIAFACFGPMLLHQKPDPRWSLPVTKGDVYVCTILIILFGRK